MVQGANLCNKLEGCDKRHWGGRGIIKFCRGKRKKAAAATSRSAVIRAAYSLYALASLA